MNKVKKQNHFKNLTNIIHHAFDDLTESIWKFVMRRQNRFKYFEN